MNMEHPQTERSKSELDLVKEEIEKTQAEILKMDSDAPEAGWLKEKLQSLDHRLSEIEKPELRTPESYGVQKESQLQEDIDFAADKLRGETGEQRAS